MYGQGRLQEIHNKRTFQSHVTILNDSFVPTSSLCLCKKNGMIRYNRRKLTVRSKEILFYIKCEGFTKNFGD